MTDTVRFDEGTLVLVRAGACAVLFKESQPDTAGTEAVLAAATTNDMAALLHALRVHVRTGSLADVAAVIAWGDDHYHLAVAGSLWVFMQDPTGSVRIEPGANGLHEVTTSIAATTALQSRDAAPLDHASGSDLLAGAVRAGRAVVPAGALMPAKASAPPPAEPEPSTELAAAIDEAHANQVVAAAEVARPAFGVQPHQQLVDLNAPVEPLAPLPTESEGPELPAASQAVMVQGVQCPAGHHNHPAAQYCASCGRRLGVNMTLKFVSGPRPPVGLLIADDGLSFSLAADVVIGRDPDSNADVAAQSVLGWRLPDESFELSRSHLRIYLDEWDVMVQDLGSANGTCIRRRDSSELEQVSAERATQLHAGDSIRVGQRELRLELHHVQT